MLRCRGNVCDQGQPLTGARLRQAPGSAWRCWRLDSCWLPRTLHPSASTRAALRTPPAACMSKSPRRVGSHHVTGGGEGEDGANLLCLPRSCQPCMLDPLCGFCYRDNGTAVDDSSCVPANRTYSNLASWGRSAPPGGFLRTAGVKDRSC